MPQRLEARPRPVLKGYGPPRRQNRFRVSRVELLLGVIIALVVILIGPWFVNSFVEFVLPSRHSGSIAGMTTTYLFKIASLLLLVGCSFWHVSDVMRNRQKELEDRFHIRSIASTS